MAAPPQLVFDRLAGRAVVHVGQNQLLNEHEKRRVPGARLDQGRSEHGLVFSLARPLPIEVTTLSSGIATEVQGLVVGHQWG